jgi:hypothetical protein
VLAVAVGRLRGSATVASVVLVCMLLRR